MDLEARKVTLCYLVQRKNKKKAAWFYFFTEENRGLECRGAMQKGRSRL